MKRLIISCSLLIALLAIGVVSLFYIKNVCSQTIEKSQITKQSIDTQDYQTASQNIKDLESYWKKNEKYLCLFVRHGEIEEISRQISELSDLLKYQDYSESSATLNRIIVIAEHIKATEKPLPIYIF